MDDSLPKDCRTLHSSTKFGPDDRTARDTLPEYAILLQQGQIHGFTDRTDSSDRICDLNQRYTIIDSCSESGAVKIGLATIEAAEEPFPTIIAIV